MEILRKKSENDILLGFFLRKKLALHDQFQRVKKYYSKYTGYKYNLTVCY